MNCRIAGDQIQADIFYTEAVGRKPAASAFLWKHLRQPLFGGRNEFDRKGKKCDNITLLSERLGDL